jgi:hypothetical protein
MRYSLNEMGLLMQLYLKFLKIPIMKKINLFFLLLLLAAVGCVKSEDNNIPTALIVASAPNYNALIVGKWQLVEVGTQVEVTASNPSNSGCGDDNSNSHSETLWSKAATSEALEFTNTGDFTKDLKNDGVCKGNFKISDNYLDIKSDCSVTDTRQPIIDINVNILVLQTAPIGTEIMRYKYVKM